MPSSSEQRSLSPEPFREVALEGIHQLPIAPIVSTIQNEGTVHASSSSSSIPMGWPLQGVFNVSGGPSSQHPWIDAKMYQAQCTSGLADQQFPSAFPTGSMVMLQPVLMPIFYGMQAPAG